MSRCGLTCKLLKLGYLLLVRTRRHKVKRVWAEAMDPLGLAGLLPVCLKLREMLQACQLQQGALLNPQRQ